MPDPIYDKAENEKNSDEPMPALPEEPTHKRFKAGSSPNVHSMHSMNHRHSIGNHNGHSNHLQVRGGNPNHNHHHNTMSQEEMTYDIFHDNNITVDTRNLTVGSHYDTPRRHLDFNQM